MKTAMSIRSRMMRAATLTIFVVALGLHSTSAFDYGLAGAGSLTLTDKATGIGDIRTIFVDEDVSVVVTGVEWQASNSNSSVDFLRWETLIDGDVTKTGRVNLSDVSALDLPTSIEAGELKIPDSGRHTITVNLYIDESEASVNDDYETFQAGASIVPLLVVLVLAMTTQMVEFSLLFAIFVGACMVAGDIKMGFKSTLDDYILNALADVGHGYVYLFTLFLSGMVSAAWQKVS